ncbi:hypothetical protein HBI36_162890 [Parastagonospora nodorum]|nr:hypothetical protein HBH78_167020 [Parastagonospora nodorum]KAH6345164.1 hypothetical protein HBI36_162890 [Parastagonospora nodorum]
MTTCSSTSRSLETQDCQDSIFPAFYQVFERVSDHSQIVSHGIHLHENILAGFPLLDTERLLGMSRSPPGPE